MENRTRHLTFFISLIFVSKNLISCVEVSSYITLDSQEDGGNSNGGRLKANMDLNEINGEITKVNSQISESSIFKLNNGNEFVRSSKMRKRSHFLQDDLIKQPTVINNIRITVNKNGTQESDVDACQNGVCNVSVSSKRDEDGNIVTDVHLNLLTKLKTTIETADIPIVNGIRGLEDAYKNLFDVQHLNRSQPSLYLHNNIPQIQTRYQGGEPWYQGPRTFQRPQVRPAVVDDKIIPLSRT
ncbi:unnamed protein product [Xylocopa violacea]|uniref:Uncharacterized protein n=1 Tax=Xylocopa violacea TaxID=135666 RepID=A0ABP1NRZ0_XYLVO